MSIASQSALMFGHPVVLNIVGVLITILLSIIAYFLHNFHVEVKDLKLQFNRFQLREASETATNKANDTAFVEAMRRYENQCANICKVTDRRIMELTKIVEKHEVEINVIKIKIS
jgi:hypothetical protein